MAACELRMHGRHVCWTIEKFTAERLHVWPKVPRRQGGGGGRGPASGILCWLPGWLAGWLAGRMGINGGETPAGASIEELFPFASTFDRNMISSTTIPPTCVSR